MVADAQVRELKKISKIVLIFLVFFLLLPYFFLFLNTQSLSLKDWVEFFWSLKVSFTQALLSSLVTILCAIIIIPGLIRVQIRKPKLFKMVELGLILPGMLPSIFIIITMINVVRPFPFGLTGIILIHVVQYSGYVAIALLHLIANHGVGLIETAQVLGASRLRTYFEILKMFKSSLSTFFLLIFTVCFTSFSVPLTVGGGFATNLEILIFEKIHIAADLDQALTISLLQSFLLFAFAVVLYKRSSILSSTSKKLSFIDNRLSEIILIAVQIFLYGGFLWSSLNGIRLLVKKADYFWRAIDFIPLSVGISLSCGIVIYFLLMLSSFTVYSEGFKRFLLAYIPPSTTLCGLAIVLLKPETLSQQILFYIFGFSLLILTSIYKMGFEQKISQLKNQADTASILGASEIFSFFKIIFPQSHQAAARLAGIAAVWMLGDFVFAKVIFSADLTFAQYLQGLISSYQFEAASALLLALILMSAIIYLIFTGFAHVYNKKSA